MRAGSSGGYTLLVAMIAPEVQYLTSVVGQLRSGSRDPSGGQPDPADRGIPGF